MYEKWIIKKWDTEIFNKTLKFRSFSHFGKFVITVTTVEEISETYEVEFLGEAAYRNFDSRYREDFWTHIGKLNPSGTGSTWIVENSDFLKMLNDDWNFAALQEGAIHYVVCTMGRIVEIVAKGKTTIKKIG